MNATAGDYEVLTDEAGGRNIHYRAGDVLAVGEVARNRVGEIVEMEPPPEPILGLGRENRPVYLFRGVADSLSAVRQARDEGVRAELNHVLLGHAGWGCDPCCTGGPHPELTDGDAVEADPVKANPVKANPVKANEESTASPVPEPTQQLSGNPGDGQPAKIWILDTGLAADGTDSSLTASAVTSGDPHDRLDEDGDDLVDVVAGHGTFIAGIIRQLGPKCTIEVRDVMDKRGRVLHAAPPAGQDPGPQRGLLEAMNDLLRKVDEHTIVNLSFGGDLDGPLGTLLAELVSEIQSKCGVVVASAGNESSCRPTYPAAFPGVVSVGAIEQDGTPAWFTNYGSWVRANALGVRIRSTFLKAQSGQVGPSGVDPKIEDFTSGWALWSGTSFAAPIVTAAIALKVNEGKTAAKALGELLDEPPKDSEMHDTPQRIHCLGVTVDPDGVDALAHDPVPSP